jgi:diguanylate cyclase (GGDEF)-like protein
MMDLDFKKKIANTLSSYELKLDKYELEIEVLKRSICQILTAQGINPDKDEHFTQLQTQLDAEFDAVAIEKKVGRLVHVIAKLDKKKEEKKRNLTSHLKQSAESLSRIANKSGDQKAIEKLLKMLDTEVEHHLIAAQFNDAIGLCVFSILKELGSLKEGDGHTNQSIEISTKVNESLKQLLEHLAIPQDLDSKRDHIKVKLTQQLTGENLSRVIDGLTELVVDAFNVEQNRFKGFLQQLTNQLEHFDTFLQESTSHHSEASKESLQLESAIQDDINQIKSHLDKSRTLEDLSSKINKNLTTIGDRIKEFRESQQNREIEHQSHLETLQSKLFESEQNAEEIKNLLTYQKYKIHHDSLTDLPNRESYDEYATEALQKWNDNKKSLTLAVADIDHFKYINDTFGHLAGDKVLKKVASIFKSSIRQQDYIARYGGEEFVLIFEGAAGEEALKIVEKLRKTIKECKFVYRDNIVDVSISFGLTSIVDGDNIESLFMRADKALYKAKDAGRNRSVIL